MKEKLLSALVRLAFYQASWADVTVDSTVSVNTTRALRSLVFSSADNGYRFYIDSNNNFVYSKTTDGGATWGAAVVVQSATTNLAFDVWFDQWTPGNSGTLIHMVYFDTTNDDVHYRTLDTGNSDTLGTLRVVFAGSTAVSGIANFCSVTVTRSGYIYVAYDIDSGVEKGLVRSTDAGVNWSANLSTAFVEINPDCALLMPASGTGDDNDCWAVYFDASTSELTLKLWDSSAGSATESASMVTIAENTSDNTWQWPFSAGIRHSDGHLIVVAHTEYNVGTADHRVFDVTSTSTITEMDALISNVASVYYSAVFIDQATDDIYIAYSGKTDGTETTALRKVYYAKSTDGGSTWAKDNAYMEGATTNTTQVYAPLMGERFYVTWRHANTQAAGNKVNSLTFSSSSTGSGTLTAQASDVDGAGTSESTGTGTPTSQASTVSGAGTSSSTGTGAPESSTATVAGEGTVAWTATGTPTAQFATASGEGTSSSTGTGTPTADAASTNGAGVSSSTGEGTPDSQDSAVAGEGTVSNGESTGTGALTTGASDVDGAGVSSSTGTGTPTSQASTASGAGTSSSTGTGAVVAQASTVSGGSELEEVTGSGTPTAQASTVAGSGTSSSTGTGTPTAQASTVAGTGTSESTGEGVLTVSEASVAGVGVSSSPGTGDVLAGSSTVSGVGTITSTGTGALSSGASTVSGFDEAPPVVPDTGKILHGFQFIFGRRKK